MLSKRLYLYLSNSADITVKASLVGESGTKTVTVTGTDDCGHTTTQNIVITVTNTVSQGNKHE
jgi:VCBS repeat-containing protein